MIMKWGSILHITLYYISYLQMIISAKLHVSEKCQKLTPVKKKIHFHDRQSDVVWLVPLIPT